MAEIVFNFDMDGVLAKWNPEASIEDTYKPGYFSARELDSKIGEALKLFREDRNCQVQILSKAYPNGYAEQEKRSWLQKHGFTEPAIIVPYGERKSDYEKNYGQFVNVLIDDYSKNLVEWQEIGPDHLAIKYRNGINGTKGSWSGPSIDYRMEPRIMKELILGTAEERLKDIKNIKKEG